MMSLKKLASCDTDEIWIDYEHKLFVKVYEGSAPEVSLPFPENEPSVSGLLVNLSDEGYLKFESEEYITLTYKAFYHSQIIRQERVRYFLRSVFVPIILAFITTLITNLVSPELLIWLLKHLQALR